MSGLNWRALTNGHGVALCILGASACGPRTSDAGFAPLKTNEAGTDGSSTVHHDASADVTLGDAGSETGQMDASRLDSTAIDTGTPPSKDASTESSTARDATPESSDERDAASDTHAGTGSDSGASSGSGSGSGSTSGSGSGSGSSSGTSSASSSSCGTVCSGACTSLQDDPHNCGACAHDCLGGACSSGLCQPVSLTGEYISTEDINYLPYVQVGAGDVYYETEINNDYVVRSIPKSGGLPKTIWDVTANPSPNSPRSFTVIEPNLYLVYYTPTFVGTQAASIDTLAVVPISGGTLKTVIAQPPRTNGDPEYFLGPASDGTSLYWVDINAGNNGFILSSLLGGASVSTPLTAMSFAPSAMEFDSTSSVYLGSNNLTATPGQPEEGVLVSTPKAGGGVTTLAATAIPGLFAVNGQNIYWWTVNGAGGAQLQMTPVSGGSTKSLPAPVAGIGPADIAQMLADDDNVYMSVGSPGANPSVYRMPAAGGASVEIATSAFGYLCIAQDAVSIYLASTDVGLWRLAK